MNMLKARLYDFELKKREKENQNQESSKSEIGWGHQIRSYVLHPYRLSKIIEQILKVQIQKKF